MNSASVNQNKKCFKMEQSDKSSTEGADMTEKVESDMDLNDDLDLPLNMSTPQIVKFIVHAIENNKLSENEMAEISLALGSSQSSAMQQSIDSCSSSFRDLDTLADTEGKLVDNILSKANPMLINFLCGITGISLSKNSASDRVKKQYALVKAIEQIHYAKDLTYISPINFAESIVSYSVTGSKIDAGLRGATTPGPSYKVLQDWHEEQESAHSEVPKQDTVIAFDNDQIISKNYRVSLNSKFKQSVITTVCAITPRQDEYIQRRFDLAPHQWRHPITYGQPGDEHRIVERTNFY